MEDDVDDSQPPDVSEPAPSASGPGTGTGSPEGGVEPEPLLHDAAGRLGYPAVPELVEEMGAVARRGNDVAALAGGGSGKELLYALAAVGQGDPGSPGVQALVLGPTREEVDRAARALHLMGAPAGLAALAWLPWRHPPRGSSHPYAQLLAGRPEELLPQVEEGRLKLGDLELLVLDGLSALEETGGWPGVEALLDTLPADAQKVVTDVRPSERLDELLTHQMGRARKWPAELFPPDGEAAPGPGAPALLSASAGTEDERLDRLGDVLRRASEEAGTDRAVVRCPDGAVAHRVAAALASRGFELTDEAEGPGVAVAWGEDEPRPRDVGVLFGVPVSLEGLEWLEEAAVRAAVVEGGHVDQLRILTRRMGWRLQPAPERQTSVSRDRIQRYRDRVRARLEASDDSAETLVLEPLLGEHGSLAVAAALSGLLREDRPPEPADEEVETAPRRPPRGGAPRGRESSQTGDGPRGRPDGGDGSTWTRLFISAGDRDDVGPGDLVGAITGETSATGDQIGRIDVRESYALVDVDPDVADEVMSKLTGATIKGREVIARTDRKS